MDAFAALKQGARKSLGKRKQESHEKVSSRQAYVTCPICTGSVPANFITFHTESCSAKRHQPAAPPQDIQAARDKALAPSSLQPTASLPAQPCEAVAELRPSAAAAGEAAAAAPPPPSPSSPAQRDTQPAYAAVQQRSAATAPEPAAKPGTPCELAPSDAAGTHNVPATQGAISMQPMQAFQTSSPASQQQQTPTTATGDTPGSTQQSQQQQEAAPKDAFALLRKGQQQQQGQQQVFFLERTPAGMWRWHWVAKGSAPPGLNTSWSGSTTINLGRAGGQAAAAGGAAGGRVVLQLHTNVPPGEGGPVAWTNTQLPSNTCGSSGKWHGSTAVLKSALQKNVRLCRAGPAVRCAALLLQEDPQELVRRLSIIALEDAVLHPALPLLVWLMAALAKGYTLGVALADVCLHVVHQLAAVPVRDYLPPPGMAPGHVPSTFSELDAALPAAEAALVKALLTRASYGGMQGDVQMLRGYAGYWTARFSGQAEPPPAFDAAGQAGATAAAAGAGALQAHGSMGSTAGASSQQAGPSSAAPGDGSSSQAGGAAGSSTSSTSGTAFLQYIRQLYNSHPGGPGCSLLQLGPLQAEDIPLSAVDFHVSDVLQAVGQEPLVQQAAAQLTLASWGAEGDAGQCMSKAMWLFSSSTSNKAWLHGSHLGRSPVSGERQRLLEDLARDEAHRQRLEQLWGAMRGPAQAFARGVVAKKLR